MFSCGSGCTGAPPDYPRVPESYCSLFCGINTYCEPNSCSAFWYEQQTQCTCVPCPTGMISMFGSWKVEQCIMCPMGTFINQAFYGNQGGRLAGSDALEQPPPCLPCPPGLYNPFPGQSACITCPPGHVPATDSTPHDTTASWSKVRCHECLPGFMALPGYPVCVPCPPGRYQPFYGKSECHDAPLGFYTPRSFDGIYGLRGVPQVASQTLVPCAPGTFQNYTKSVGLPNRPGNGCRRCPAGTYAAAEGKGNCLPCPEGYSNALVGQTQCTPCKRGFASLGTGARVCTRCTNLGHRNETGLTGCGFCAGGYFGSDDDRSSCTACPTGQYSGGGADVCQNCPSGQSNNNKASTFCFSCGPGTYASERSVNCQLCPDGTYQPWQERGDCINCPSGAICPAGSTSFTLCAVRSSSSSFSF